MKLKKFGKTLKWKKLREYDALCLKTDVLLLADVYENFVVISIKNYGLNPLNYVPAPGLSWDSFLKKSKAKLELTTVFSMLIFLDVQFAEVWAWLQQNFQKVITNIKKVMLQTKNRNLWLLACKCVVFLGYESKFANLLLCTE